MRYFLLLAFISLLLFCHSTQEDEAFSNMPDPGSISILSLGDSYTKGESIPWKENFPHQLADSLLKSFPRVQEPLIIARTGWRTDDLQDAIDARAAEIGGQHFDLVTLCIGVNNQYQHSDFEVFKQEFETLLRYALTKTNGRKNRVLVLSIPDWAYTPYGQNYTSAPNQISAENDLYNEACKAIAAEYGVQFHDITPVSRLGLQQPDLIAPDGLHPSEKQYARWVRQILPGAKTALAQ